ncbi:nudix domain-containing protein [Moniliophthora roreri MCA 2997]|uniref:Nudix domain-containing protein n=1 Tax=Moniliophthora roreri (strain MCA 2997) TaxID=1381753 RepID=V2YIX2_MONRO|nr:nudix domain-containing protein [Moniliophthora roreri MCA 2997]
MSLSSYPFTTYPAGQFVICAGSILFRRVRAIQATSTSSSSGAFDSLTASSSNPNTNDNSTNITKWKWQICLLFHRTKNEWLLPKGRKDAGESVEVAAVRETFEETGYPNSILPVTLPTRAPITGTNQKDVIRIAQKCNTEPIAITVRDVSSVPLVWANGYGPDSEQSTTPTFGNSQGSTKISNGHAPPPIPNAKLIYWYATIVQSQAQVHADLPLNASKSMSLDLEFEELVDAEQQSNTQTATENFDARFFDVDAVEEGDIPAIERLTFQGDRDIAAIAIALVKGTYGG